MAANPADITPPLRLAEELEKVKRAFRQLETEDLVRIDYLPRASLAALRQKLFEETYHILHFVGHGGVDASIGSYLVFEKNKTSEIVKREQFTDVLRDAQSLRLVLLNACVSADLRGTWVK